MINISSDDVKYVSFVSEEERIIPISLPVVGVLFQKEHGSFRSYRIGVDVTAEPEKRVDLLKKCVRLVLEGTYRWEAVQSGDWALRVCNEAEPTYRELILQVVVMRRFEGTYAPFTKADLKTLFTEKVRRGRRRRINL